MNKLIIKVGICLTVFILSISTLVLAKIDLNEINLYCKYDYIGDYNNKIIIVGKGENNNERLYGIINIKGEEIVPCIYKEIKRLDNIETVDSELFVVKKENIDRKYNCTRMYK